MKFKIFILLAITLISGCKKDFLTRMPLDQMTDNNFWTTEGNVRTFSWGFYPAYFVGYGSGYTWGSYFTGETLNDDFAPPSPNQFTKNVPASGGGWSFGWVKKANLFLDRVKKVPMSAEAINHWTGVARFFRAMEYSDLVKSFGDVPWYGRVLKETETAELYRTRDSRTLVMDSVLADFKYAADNVRAADGVKGLTVNKYVVLAYMSRNLLFEGSWQKYHNNNLVKATEYFEAAKWAANEVMTKGGYTLSSSYRGVFSSLDLLGNTETIMFRRYETALLTHSLNSYVNKEPQTGVSKDAIDTYLSKDGLPISVSPLYKGDKTINDVMTDRDPRLTETFVNQIRLNGDAISYSTSGYACQKFLNEAIKDQINGNGSLNDTDAPVIRLGEVLVNYAEACAELGTMTQTDLDNSIKKLRQRPGINMPVLQVIGNLPAINGVVYDDPKRDQTVPSLIWEIRRERRVELMMEGFRYADLRRWKKLNYTDTQLNKDINRGAWIVKAAWPKAKDVTIENNAAAGYIVPAWKPESQRAFIDAKVYLSPLPLDQITLYKAQGVELTQNPGW